MRGPETSGEIAARYGVTRQAVSLVRLAVGVNRCRATRIVFAESDLLSAKTAVELAKKYGCHEATIRKWRQAARERAATRQT